MKGWTWKESSTWKVMAFTAFAIELITNNKEWMLVAAFWFLVGELREIKEELKLARHIEIKELVVKL